MTKEEFLAELKEYLAYYETALHQAFINGETTKGTYDIRAYNADRFVTFVESGKLNIRGVQRK